MSTPVPASHRVPMSFSPRLAIEDPLAAHWLRDVTLRLRREICWLWRERGVLAGLTMPVSALPPFTDRLAATLDLARYDEEKRAFFVQDATAGYLTQLLEQPRPEGRELDQALRGGFTWLARELALTPVDCFVLALALSPAVDGATASVFAAVQNDPGRAFPTLALAQRLWDVPDDVLALVGPGHSLCRNGVLIDASDWDAAISVHAPIARQLLYPSSPLPASLEHLHADSVGGSAFDMAHNREDPSLLDDPVIDRELELTLARLRGVDDPGTIVVPVQGPRGASLSSVAARLAGALSVEAVRPAAGVRPSELGGLCTLAWLRGAVLHVPVSMLAATREHDAPITPPLRALPIVITVGIDDPAAVKRLPSEALPAIHIRPLSYRARLALWRTHLGNALQKNPDLDGAVADTARRFRHEAPVIIRVCRTLAKLGRAPRAEDLHAACRADVDLGELAQRLEPRFQLADLMLPPKQARQIDEMIRAVRCLTAVHYEWGTARAWNESGLSALFAGAPGTGKTMAAEVIAAEADMPLYRIDLSQVVNKYIGETEKNLRRLFDAADTVDAILFFDEADALFGKRTEVRDAHDRYANLEVSYLLERMERFKGLAILATNRKKDLDEAFLRRLRFVIDFPLPGEEERRRIWKSVIPAEVDASALDLPFLASRFPLAGGHIRAVVFHACLQSAGSGSERRLDMPTVLRAVRREMDKLGRATSREQFGPFADGLED
jgi:ATPase family protein associated with various cellular activities (AAA)